MNRREFITRMFGAAVALPLIQALKLPLVEPKTLPVGAWDSTLFAAHREAWKLYQQKFSELGWQIAEIASVNDALLGHTLPSGILITDQCNVTVSRDAMQPSIEAAMAALAHRAAYNGVDSYATLSMPVAGVEYVGYVGALRMVSHYDVVQDDMLVRFDVLGGSSPVGQIQKRKMRERDLKDRIRRRLASDYKRPSPIPA